MDIASNPHLTEELDHVARHQLRFNHRYQSAYSLFLMLRPRSGAEQWITREEYRLDPSVPVFEFTDNYGNLCQRLIAPAGTFEISTNAEVMTADHVEILPYCLSSAVWRERPTL